MATQTATKPKARSSFLASLTDDQLRAFIREIGCEVAPEDTNLANEPYKDEVTIGRTPWPGDDRAVRWQPHENPNPAQRMLLMRACWRLLTGQELPELPQLRTAEIEVYCDFECGYCWPQCTLRVTRPDAPVPQTISRVKHAS
jgi:hypothetical protein